MKKIFFLLCFVASILSLTSCNNSELAEFADYFNSKCPQSIGEVGEITCCEYDDENIIMTLSVNEEFMDIDAISKNEEMWKKNALISIQNTEAMHELSNLLEKAEAGLTYKYIGKKTKKQCTLHLNSEDIAKISQTKETDPLAFLQAQMNITKMQLPISVDEGMLWTSLELKGKYVEYYYECDEDYWDMKELKNCGSDMKQEILESYNDKEDKEMQMLKKSLKDANMGCKYKYVGKKTKKSFTITIEPSEL